MHAPDGDQVGGVPATDDHDVLIAHEGVDVVDGAIEQRQMAEVAGAAGELPVEGEEVGGIVARRGRQEEHGLTRA